MFRTQRLGPAALLLATLSAAALYGDENLPAGRLARKGETFRVVAPDYPWTQVAREPGDAAGFQPPIRVATRCIPGEFEEQRALLLACRDLVDDFPELLTDVVKSTQGKIQLILLVSDLEQSEQVTEHLRAKSVTHDHVHFVQLPHDTMWARDYGPIVVRSKSGPPVVIDPDYDMDRMQDDRVPSELGRLLNLEVDPLPLRLDGGNLLSNGAGLVITTSRLFDENAYGDIEEAALRKVLRDRCGVEQMAVLEPLAGEPTGHADMFATFVSKNVVVVGRISPEIDAMNAEILDRNAIQLSKIKTGGQWLHVVRIDMPTHEDGVWRTYTNVIFANGVLMVPTYEEADRPSGERALGTYSKLLPRWKVVGIDATHVIKSEGALHCMTMNLGPLGRLPEFPQPQPRVDDALDLFEDDVASPDEENLELGPPDIFRADAPQPLDPAWPRAAANRLPMRFQRAAQPGIFQRPNPAWQRLTTKHIP